MAPDRLQRESDRLQSGDRLQHDEVHAALSARRELGLTYEQELAESLVDRVNAVIDAKLDDRKRRQAPASDWAQMALGISSLALLIPLLAVTRDNENAMIAVVVIIAVVNAAYALRSLLQRRS